MSLRNLLGISLDAVTPDREQIARLLAAADRNLVDAQLQALSIENRFDAAYKAVMQSAMVALLANGYRPLTSKPGHHQTALQTLVHSVGYPMGKIIVLDALRKQRNLSDYSGDLVTDAVLVDCLTAAAELLEHVKAWLRAHRPDLLESASSPTVD